MNAHNFSRVPVYGDSLDHITGIAFARDLLAVKDADAATRTVAQLQRPALFIPETKKVNELLREMQRQKQHMGIVIDEYGGVAGLVTIEDLIEAIVGEIERRARYGRGRGCADCGAGGDVGGSGRV